MFPHVMFPHVMFPHARPCRDWPSRVAIVDSRPSGHGMPLVVQSLP
jgi:hypothetical protein